MPDYLVRITIFIVCFIVLVLWQSLLPKRQLTQYLKRWRQNMSLFFLDSLLVRLIQPILLSFIAISTSHETLLNLTFLAQHPALNIILAIILLDFAIYWQHRASHLWPVLWRLHQVHHSDPQVDVTTAVRFHPLEILLSLLYKTTLIYLFSIPFEAILIFDILLNACALFNHTNGYLPKKLDTGLRLFLVTPDMHRLHHSQKKEEANSNYGFCLSLWDRIFKSYTKQAQEGDLYLKVGHPTYADLYEKKPEKLTVLYLIKMPFLSKKQ